MGVWCRSGRAVALWTEGSLVVWEMGFQRMAMGYGFSGEDLKMEILWLFCVGYGRGKMREVFLVAAFV